MNLSAVVLTKDEENNIKKCLSSLSFCDETIVVDDYSKGKTVEIAKKMGAIMFKRKLNEDFAGQRNFALSKSKGKWVLFVDADEEVTELLAKEIVEKISQEDSVNGYYINRQDCLWGKRLMHGESGSVKLLRLAKRDIGKWKGKVHEVWKVNGKTDTLSSVLLHYPHKFLRNFIKEINFYTEIHAKEKLQKGIKSNLFKIVFYPVFKLFINLILKLGILDGIRGFVAAVVMSFHSYLSWSKLWLLQNKRK